MWAGTPTTYHHASEELRIEESSNAASTRIKLEPLRDDQMITGVVLDSRGQPADDALVMLCWPANGKYEFASAYTGEHDGGFILRSELVAVGASIVVEDLFGNDRTATLEGVTGGDRDLVLRLQPPRYISFEVFDGEANLTPMAALTLEVERGGRWWPLENASHKASLDAQMKSYMLPAEPFRVKVGLNGYQGQLLGPFDPEHVETILHVNLTICPRVVGRVLAGGEPLGGASVSMEGGYSVPIGIGDGSYAFACTQTGSTVIVARHPQLGTVTSERFELPERGSIEVNVEFGEFGSLSGKVVTFEEERALADRNLYLHNNTTGNLRYVPLEENGSFSVPQLRAGVWSLSLESPFVGTDLTYLFNTYSNEFEEVEVAAPPQVPYLVEVVAGAKSEVDLNFGIEPTSVLSGSFRFNYNRAWGGGIGMCGTGMPTPDIRLLDLDSLGIVSISGNYRSPYFVGSREPGAYRVQATALVFPDDLVTFWRDIVLRPGQNEWNFENTAGRLRVRMFPEEVAAPRYLKFKWSDEGGTFGSGPFRDSWNSDYHADAVVPSGCVEIYWCDDEVEQRLHVIDVAPNEDIAIELSRY